MTIPALLAGPVPEVASVPQAPPHGFGQALELAEADIGPPPNLGPPGAFELPDGQQEAAPLWPIAAETKLDLLPTPGETPMESPPNDGEAPLAMPMALAPPGWVPSLLPMAALPVLVPAPDKPVAANPSAPIGPAEAVLLGQPLGASVEATPKPDAVPAPPNPASPARPQEAVPRPAAEPPKAVPQPAMGSNLATIVAATGLPQEVAEVLKPQALRADAEPSRVLVASSPNDVRPTPLSGPTAAELPAPTPTIPKSAARLPELSLAQPATPAASASPEPAVSTPRAMPGPATSSTEEAIGPLAVGSTEDSLDSGTQSSSLDALVPDGGAAPMGTIHARSDVTPPPVAVAVEQTKNEPLTEVEAKLAIRQIAERLEAVLLSRRPSRLTVRLEPERLGTVEINVKLFGSRIDADLTASHEGLRTALDQYRPQLVQAVETRGFNVNSLTVSSDSGANPFGNQTFERPQGQPGREPGSPSVSQADATPDASRGSGVATTRYSPLSRAVDYTI